MMGRNEETMKKAEWALAHELVAITPEEFVTVMQRTHRTNQQQFMKRVMEWIFHLSTREQGQYDLRNEETVKVAKQIAEALGEKPYFPLI